MHCVKALLTHPGRHFFLKNFVHSEKSNAFPRWNIKVNLCCTAVKMEIDLEPPKSVNGMKVLDKSAFQKRITISCLDVTVKNLPTVMNLVKKYLLKINQVKSPKVLDNGKRRILLNPQLINDWNSFDESTQTEFQKLEISKVSFSKVSLDLKYENWNANSLLKAVLPGDACVIRSFSMIGHIVHLNLKEHLLDYKYIIADILLDKLPLAKTVVYKKKRIENVYRNFDMEVVRGENNFMVSVKENGCTFEFDFSKVYWNPRLSTEHQRILEMVQYSDVLFDVFAGVGPFAIPAAKKKCKVFANDLNPDSFKWLNHNIKLNKKAKEYITTFNKDGGDFILSDAKSHLIKIWQDDLFNGKIYFVMNLPALAPEFLKYFKGLITKDDIVNLDLQKAKTCLPIILCHFFGEQTKNKREVFEQKSGIDLNDIQHKFFLVRTVSNSVDMHRITFELPFDYIMGATGEQDLECSEPLPKRVCTS